MNMNKTYIYQKITPFIHLLVPLILTTHTLIIYIQYITHIISKLFKQVFFSFGA